MRAGATTFQDDGPIAALISDGRRLHLQHGPIDLIIEAEGARDEVLAAYRQARKRFRTVLVELVDELAMLRLGVDRDVAPTGDIAKRMKAAALPFADDFITPMAAVAGAVADEVLASLIVGRRLSRAFVNNGGDIAFHLGAGERYVAALVGDPVVGRVAGRATVWAENAIRGIATSGRHGRSHSLGIADAVTVLAGNAADADAAATMIANAVDLPTSPKIERAPARALYPDSDLGDRLVTTGVRDLEKNEIDAALDAGYRYAMKARDRGLIEAAFLSLATSTRVLGDAMDQTRIEFETELETTG
jgi:ApbE superfamily uncharacterized protein (UPF0280 family)